MNDLTSVKLQVEHILKNVPSSRGNDKLLQVLVLKKFYGVHEIDDILRPDIPSLESIRRCRQKLQECGAYEAPDNIKKIRGEMEEIYREFAVTNEE